MKIRSLLVAALPAALLLSTLPTSGAPAQSSTATLSRAAAEEYYVIIHYRDQAELQGLLQRMSDLGLTLLGVNAIDDGI